MLADKPRRTPVTVEMMVVIKRRLHEVTWDPVDKHRFWAIATLLFAGSLRVSEALSKTITKPCMQTTLLKRDLTIGDLKVSGAVRKIIKIKLKSPKVDRNGAGTTLEIFGNGTFLCPVKALEKYITFKGGDCCFEDSKPLFMQTEEDCYTGKSFNSHLSILTADATDCTVYVVQSHSFRARVPSEMARRRASEQQIMGINRPK